MITAQRVFSQVVDLRQLQVIPGVAKENTSVNTRKLLHLAEATVSGDLHEAFFNDLDSFPAIRSLETICSIREMR